MKKFLYIALAAVCTLLLVSACNKPDPEPTRMALEKLGTRPEETLCVGDAPFDLISARAAGCHMAAVEYTQFDRKKFAEMIEPEVWLKDMGELLPLLKRANL